MRIDINAYLGLWDFRNPGIDDPELLLAKEEEAGVDVAVVSAPGGLVPDATFESNEELLARIEPYDDRLFLAARVDPAWDMAKQLEFLSRPRVAAIRLPAQRKDDHRQQEAELIGAASAAGLPVYLTLEVAHLWSVAEHMEAEDVEPIVSSYPDAAFVLAGEGQFQYPCLRDVILSFNNVCLDTSRNCGLRVIEKYVGEFGAERVLFGTAAGILHPCVTRDRVEKARIEPDVREMVYSGNALRLFKRLPPSSARAPSATV